MPGKKRKSPARGTIITIKVPEKTKITNHSFNDFYNSNIKSLSLWDVLNELKLKKCYIVAPEVTQEHINKHKHIAELVKKKALNFVSPYIELIIVEMNVQDYNFERFGNKLRTKPHHHTVENSPQLEFLYLIDDGGVSAEFVFYNVFSGETTLIKLKTGEAVAWTNNCVQEKYPLQKTVALVIKVPGGDLKQECGDCRFAGECRAPFKL